MDDFRQGLVSQVPPNGRYSKEPISNTTNKLALSTSGTVNLKSIKQNKILI